MDHVPREVENSIADASSGKLTLDLTWLCQVCIDTNSKINLATAMEFLDYAPQARNHLYNYDHYLDRLGFGTGKDAHHMWATFTNNLRNYVKSSGSEHIRKTGDKQAYEMMIKQFLSEYGTTYWGSSKRVHLVEKDPSKGVLYPRDTERKNSTY